MLTLGGEDKADDLKILADFGSDISAPRQPQLNQGDFQTAKTA